MKHVSRTTNPAPINASEMPPLACILDAVWNYFNCDNCTAYYPSPFEDKCGALNT